MNKKSLLIIGFAVLVGGLLISDRFLGNPPQTSVTSSRGGVSSIVVAGNIVDNTNTAQDITNIAPDFTLTTLSGGTLTLSDYRGQKAVVLDFFATWCPNCRRDMPKLNKFYEKYKDDIEVIGVDLRENPQKVADYITSAGIDFPIVLDSNGAVARLYGMRYTNVHVLINKSGEIVRTILGDIQEQDLQILLEG